MIKLGIIYKEFYLIENGMINLEYYDLKTAHLLMQYIVETSDLHYIVNNKKDNFFIYLIRTAINYMIKLYKSRTEKLKNNVDFTKSKFLKNTKFLNKFNKYKDFKELIILSKYLDVLRKLDNEIYYQREICKDSLTQKINNLNVLVQNKNIDLKDITDFKTQLYEGKVSDAKNFIIQISKSEYENISILILEKMLVELYCYKILQDSEKTCSLCINILRNVSYNPNLFFKNIANKTQIKSLRNYLLNHLKHSQFTSHDDAENLKIIKYLDEHYSNPSFNVEYNLKATKILLSKEFKKITFDSMVNKNYKVNTSIKNINLEYLSIIIKINENVNLNSLNERTNSGNLRQRKKVKSYKKISLFHNHPLLTETNLRKLDEILYNKYTYILKESYYSEIYYYFFSNSEIDDFGMDKTDEKTYTSNKVYYPLFLQTEYTDIVTDLYCKYFKEHDENIYKLSSNDVQKTYDCILCKKVTNSQADYIDTNTLHLGYSNISIENLKYFDISNIIRIKFDDYIQIETNTNSIIAKFRFKDLSYIKSFFYYITGHYTTNLLTIFVQKLIATQFFHRNFIESSHISTEYFSKHTKQFTYLKKDMMKIFNFEDNSHIKEIIFTNFIKHGILIDNYENVQAKTLRKLISNNLIKFQEKTYFTYNNIKECEDDVIQSFIINRKYDIKNYLERSSNIDEKMDEFILYNKNNHYLLQTFLDFNLLNPKSIFFKHQQKLNAWQRVILLSKFNTNANIFEKALENFKILKEKYLNEKLEDKYEHMLVFYGCLIYLKVQNKDYTFYLGNIPEEIYKGINSTYKSFMPKLLLGDDIVLNPIQNKEDTVISNPNDESEFEFKNNIFTCNKDISIKSLLHNYYKFLITNSIVEWENRSHNYSINLDDFEILLENGRVLDAYYYYKDNIKHFSEVDLEIYLYNICLNNLLNYNVFAAIVTFLHLLNWQTKTTDMIVRIEVANRILLFELNKLVREMQLEFSVEEAITYVKLKNYNFNKKKYLEIKDENINNQLKLIIAIYKKLVSEFREFTQKNNTRENIIFQILKRLEDATWDGKKDDLLNNSKEITLDSPWHLVFLFCKTHNYPMSLTLLHELGRNNNWIMFLHKAQDQECPPATVKKILDGYFSDSNLKNHLNITIRGLLDSQVEEDTNNTNNINNVNTQVQNNSTPEEKDREKYVSHNKVDFGKFNFSEFVIYNIKQKQAKQNAPPVIYDPLYYISSPEFNKEKGPKNYNILHEALIINWKDLVIDSLIFTNCEQEIIFTSFTLYLYMSIKEILITKNYLEDLLMKCDGNKNTSIGRNLIKNLREIFDNKKKTFLKLYDLEILIKILLLNNHSQVLLEVLELFNMPYSFDEFVLFCKSLFENDYEQAFIHLFIFKSSMYEYFNERFSNNFTAKVWEEEGNVNNIHSEFINSEIKTFDNLILAFFYQVSNTIINNLIELYESERFKLFKLLEILYLTKWNKRYSNYFKNMCILDYIKEGKHSLNYKSSFDNIVELLILENNFTVLSEYILSYEENKVDDTLLYNIFSTISSFEKNYVLYNDEERNQFWEWLEKLLKDANVSNFTIAKFFLYILETKEENFYIREQLTLIFKIYQYLILDNQNYKHFNENDKFSIFMKTVMGYEIEKQCNVNDLVEDLKNKIFIIIFSNCEFEKLKIIFMNKINFEMAYLFEYYSTIIKELREESPAINFSIISKNFWKISTFSNKIKQIQEYNKNDIESIKLTNFNEAFRKACLNLINLNQLVLALQLSKFYNQSIEELDKFNTFMIFLIEKFNDLKLIPPGDLNIILNKAINKTLETNTLLLKSYSFDIKEKLEILLKNCLDYKSIERIVLYEILKILIAIEINLDISLFKNFDDNIDHIMYKLIDNSQGRKYIMDNLNKIIDNDELLAKTLVEKFFFYCKNNHKNNIKLFKYVKYFKFPYKLGFAIQKHINDKGMFIIGSKELNSLDSNYWELIFLGYDSFLKDCYHNELINLTHIIRNNIDEKNFFHNIFQLFSICEDEDRVKEIFYCINRILINNKESSNNRLLINEFKNKLSTDNLNLTSGFNIFGRFKSEIEFYFKSKNYKKLGEIYVKLANDYAILVKQKNLLVSKYSGNKNKSQKDIDITRKEQELTILNLYIRAAELFLLDNCILNYSKVFNDINILIKENFKDDIDIVLE